MAKAVEYKVRIVEYKVRIEFIKRQKAADILKTSY